MGVADWWDQEVVSRLIRVGCCTDVIMAVREQVVPLATGRVFELGCGAGANQRFYDPARVTGFAAIDPSPKLLAQAQVEAAPNGWSANIVPGLGEAIPFADASFDTVVSTYTLCSVRDHDRTLAELRRVLKPGGMLIYAEHGRAPDPSVQRWQRRIEPVWKRLLGNCHLTRPVTDALAASGFAPTPIDRRYVDKSPRFAGWMEWGTAIRTD